MRLTPRPISPADINGFDNTDLFKRRAFGEQLRNLVVNIEEPLVISLEAPWGEGKTTFIHQWMNYLDSDAGGNIKSIYFDAFKSDFHDDAFLALTSVVYSYAKKGTTANDKLASLKSSAVSVLKALPGTAARAGIGVLPFGDLGSKFLEALASGVVEDIANATDTWMEERLENQAEASDIVDAFQNSIREIVDSIYSEPEGGVSTSQKVIVIIDELDRCRPTFALQLLEKVKHIFSMDSVVFVLVNNPKQLQESVAAAYGVGIDAHRYLQKFYTISLSLPKNIPLDKYGDCDLKRYMTYLLTEFDLNNSGHIEYFITAFSKLAVGHRSSLRDLEKAVSYLVLYASECSLSNYDGCESFVISFLCTVKAQNPLLFNRIISGDYCLDEIREFIRLSDLKRFDREYVLGVGWIFWMFMRSNDKTSDQENELLKSVEAMVQKDRNDTEKRRDLNHLLRPLLCAL